ncbi:flagellar hook-length control protein FliK [Ruegeria sp.]|uniref:flagellar hook-length control protein FliK n=1 Tax=Ruegeria sp. TaxID=1879320 RepID=UPI003B5AE906
MPNPLTAVISTPTSATKPGPDAQNPRDADGMASFQSVLDQETPQHPDVPETEELVVQDPDLHKEDADDESVLPEVSVDLESPLDDAKPTSQQLPRDPIAKEPSDVLPVAALPPEADVHMRDEVQPVRPEAPVFQLGQPDQRPLPPAFQAFAQPRNVPDLATKPRIQAVGMASEATLNKKAAVVFGVEPERGTPAPAAPIVAAPQSARPDRPPSFVQMQLMATDTSGMQGDSVSPSEVEDIQSVREAPGHTPTRDAGTNLHALTASARSETARAVANQMASVITARPQSGTIEVALNPEELGRVSIVMNGRDDGLHMTIAAERPETLDMMRRHISVLEAEFRNLGLGDLSFDLGTSSDAQQDGSDPDTDDQFMPSQSEQVAEVDSALPRIGADGRIDIRL